jgi:hypothetical protein
MKLLTAAAALLVAALGLTAPAHAQKDDVGLAAPGRTVTFVTEADLRAIVLAQGLTIESARPHGDVSVQGRTAEGLLFVLIGTACASDGVTDCQGVLMQIRYDSDKRVTLENVNRANVEYASVTTWWDQSAATVGFTRYVPIIGGGVTMQYLRQNLQTLFDVEPLPRVIVFP